MRTVTTPSAVDSSESPVPCVADTLTGPPGSHSSEVKDQLLSDATVVVPIEVSAAPSRLRSANTSMLPPGVPKPVIVGFESSRSIPCSEDVTLKGTESTSSVTEKVSLAVELSRLDVAITVTLTVPVASPTGVRTRSPLPLNDAVSFAESELEAEYVNNADSVTTSAFSIFTKSCGWTMLS